MVVAVIMPKLEMSQEAATVVQWIKGEGDRVKKGEPLLTVETDKVTLDIESPASGVLSGIRAQPDEVVPVTEVIAYVLGEGEDLPEGSVIAPPSPPSVTATPVAQRMAADHHLDLAGLTGTGPGGRITKSDVAAALAGTAVSVGQAPSNRVRATPAARRVARERGIDLWRVSGSGPRGRIQEADVLAFELPTEAPEESEVEVVPLSGMRRTIAARMQHSYQTAPHITLTVEADMSAIQVMRRELNARAEALGAPRVSITAVLVKVCAWALQHHRRVNASLHGEDIHLHKRSNIGVAVALEEGLIVPVIHGAEQLGIAEIVLQLSDLAERAREGRLVPQDVSGGTFTISNLGMYGIDRFTAILNPPESAILAVGRIAKRQVVVERDGRDEAAIRPMMHLTLSADHRILDGALAARFLRDVADALEHPNLLLW